MHKMTIAKTLNILGMWASDADLRAFKSVDAFGVVEAAERARLYRAMVQTIQDAIAAGAPVPSLVIPTKKPRANAKPKAMDALAFWRLHGQAVEACRAKYGERWKVVAPFGETDLVGLPACWASFTTERGTKLKWSRDQRVPAARFWPSGELPALLEVRADYPRESSESAFEIRRAAEYPRAVESYEHAVKAFRFAMKGRRNDRSRGWGDAPATERALRLCRLALDARRELRALPKPGDAKAAVRDSAWYHAHGYVLVGTVWISELLHRSQIAHEEGIIQDQEFRRVQKMERAALTYGPQPAGEPFADIADDMDLSEAAD